MDPQRVARLQARAVHRNSEAARRNHRRFILWRDVSADAREHHLEALVAVDFQKPVAGNLIIGLFTRRAIYQKLAQRHPARPSGFWRGADGARDMQGYGICHLDKPRHLGFMNRYRLLRHRAVHAR